MHNCQFEMDHKLSRELYKMNTKCVMSADEYALTFKPESVGFIQVMNGVNSI